MRSRQLVPGLALALLLGISGVGCAGSQTLPEDDAGSPPGKDTGSNLCAHCGSGQKCCGETGKETCTPVSSDMNNCGDCGQKCQAPQADSCVNGACACGSTAPCASGQTCCPNTGCKSVKSDVNNCGGCGKTCKAGESCDNGVCKAPPGACGGKTCNPAAEQCCSNQCINVKADPNNCGMCGSKCQTGQTCQNGSCSGGGGDCQPPCQPLDLMGMFQLAATCKAGQCCFDTSMLASFGFPAELCCPPGTDFSDPLTGLMMCLGGGMLPTGDGGFGIPGFDGGLPF
jgi:hypothetical protein